MKIKNKKSGKLIEVPKHLEADVTKAISLGIDPLSILQSSGDVMQNGGKLPKYEIGGDNTLGFKNKKRNPNNTLYEDVYNQDFNYNTQQPIYENSTKPQNLVTPNGTNLNQPNFNLGNINGGFQGFDQYNPNKQFNSLQPLKTQQLSNLPDNQLQPDLNKLPDLGMDKSPREYGTTDYNKPKFDFQNVNVSGFGNQYLAKGAGQLTSGLMNLGKGAVDLIENKNELLRNQKQITAGTLNGAENNIPDPYQFGQNFNGANMPLGENGMQIKQMGGYGEPNVEIEGLEHVMLPNGMSQEVQGNSHAEGGIPLNLPEGSKVFSEKLKLNTPKGKKSYADLAKKYETKKDVDMLNAKTGDAIQKSTAEMLITFKKSKLEQLFEKQEQDKLSGVHGLGVQMEAIQSLQQEQHPEQEQPIAKYGMKLPKAGNGWINQILAHERKAGQPGGLPDTQGIYNDDQWTGANAYKFQKYIDDAKAEVPNFDKLPEAIQATLVDYKFNNGNRSIKDLLLRAEGKINGEQLNSNQKFNITPNFKLLEDPSFVKKIAIAKEDAYLSQAEKNKPGFQGNFDNNFFPRTHMWDNYNVNGQIPNTTSQNQQTPNNRKSFNFTPFKTKQGIYLPYKPNEIWDEYGTDLKLERSLQKFDFRDVEKYSPEEKRKLLKTIRTYQAQKDPTLVRHYKDNFARGNNQAYKDFTSEKGYKKGANDAIESENFRSWSNKNNRPLTDYIDGLKGTDQSQWGHELFNKRMLDFETEDEYNKWKLDKDWKQVPGTNSYVDMSAYDPANSLDPNSVNPDKGVITYYDINKKWEKKSPEKKKAELEVKKDNVKFKSEPPINKIEPNINIPLAFPNMYNRIPENMVMNDPSYIDPRYLDVAPQLNQVTRGQRALQNNLGDRGASNMSNLLQSQINAYGQNQEIYGQKYNYDRGQDASTQQFNAQARMNTGQFNTQANINPFLSRLEKRESNIGDQQLTDQYRALERNDQAIAFNNNKNYIDKTFSNYSKMTKDQYLQEVIGVDPNKFQQTTEEDAKTKKKKSGGIVKSKLKIKPKIKK